MALTLDTEALRTFLKIAAVGSLTRAAELSGMSQPSLTRLVRDIETEIGTKLFERNRRGVVLTDEGRRFSERATAVLDGFDRLVLETGASDAPVTGTIGVGIPYSMTETIALPLVRWLRDNHPEASISLQQGVSHEIEQELVFGQIDLGILISPQTRAPLKSARPLASESLHLFAKPGQLPDGRLERAGWDDLRGCTLILPRRQNVLRRRIDQAAAQRGLDLKIAAEVSNPEATLQLVAEGVGVTVLPASLGAARVAIDTLTAVPLGNESVVWTLGVSAFAAKTRLRDVVEAQLVTLFETQVSAGKWRPAGQGAASRPA